MAKSATPIQKASDLPCLGKFSGRLGCPRPQQKGLPRRL